MEKLLLTSNITFSHSVFKRLVLQTRKNQDFFRKGLNESVRKLKLIRDSIKICYMHFSDATLVSVQFKKWSKLLRTFSRETRRQKKKSLYAKISDYLLHFSLLIFPVSKRDFIDKCKA